MSVICKILFLLFLYFDPKCRRFVMEFTSFLFVLLNKVLHDIVESIGQIGLKVFLFLHERKFHENVFDNLSEFDLISFFLIVSFEYFSRKDLDQVKDQLIISLFLVSGSKS